MIEGPRKICYLVGGGEEMKRYFTLEYWTNDGWFVGRLKDSLARLIERRLGVQ